MPLNNIRKTPSEIKKFLESVNITDANYSLFERMLDFRDDAFVSTLNSIIDEKIVIEDTNPKLSSIWKIESEETDIPSPKLEGESKLLSIPKELIFTSATGVSIYDQTKSNLEKDRAIEISNLKSTLSMSLLSTEKIDDPYVVIHKDKFKEDFKKAASLYLLIKSYPDISAENVYHYSGIDILELFIDNFQDIYINYLINQEDFDEFSFFNRFKREVFLPDGFSFSYSDQTHNIKYTDLAVISDEIVKEIIETKD